MAGVLFFEKNIADLDNDSASITVTDLVATNSGQDYVNYLRDRTNATGWATTDSDDSALTKIEVDLGDTFPVTDVFLLRNNFKDFHLEYWDGAAYQDLTPIASQTANTEADLRISFDEIETSKFRLTINKTFVVDDDKFLSQFIVTRLIGQFSRVIEIAELKIARNRRTIKTLSGKAKIQRGVGAVSCVLRDNNVTESDDHEIVEYLTDSIDGFLVWLCGGDTTQFSQQRIGYRRQDLYLMNMVNEYAPTYEKGFFKHGIPINLQLVEVI